MRATPLWKVSACVREREGGGERPREKGLRDTRRQWRERGQRSSLERSEKRERDRESTELRSLWRVYWRECGRTQKSQTPRVRVMSVRRAGSCHADALAHCSSPRAANVVEAWLPSRPARQRWCRRGVRRGAVLPAGGPVGAGTGSGCGHVTCHIREPRTAEAGQCAVRTSTRYRKNRSLC